MSISSVLSQKSLGPGALFVLAVTASSPMTVLAGGIPVTFAATGVVGVPLAFLLLVFALIFCMYAFATASQYVKHPAAAYGLISQCFGGTAGLASAGVALLSYNAIQISLFGLIGPAALSVLFGGPWWVWALIAWFVIAVVGTRAPGLNVGVLAILLVAQMVITASIAYLNLNNAADGISWSAFDPDKLFVAGVGGAFAFCMAAYTGFETPMTYSEEAKPHAVRRAAPLALLFGGLVYAVLSWSMTVQTGPDAVVDAARAEELPFGPLGRFAPVGVGVFALAMLAAMIAFHNTVARYIFALGRERVLPRRLAKTTRKQTPIAGSLAQSALALMVILLAVALDIDPLTELFTWLSTLAAMGILTLIVVCSGAAIRFFQRGHGRNEGPFVTFYLPALGVLLGGAALAVMVWNVEVLLGVEPGSHVTLILPGALILAALTGVLWASILRATKPKRYQALGRGKPHPHEVPDRNLADVII